ncbi:MAG: sulfite exporter TauE/SafE family protein [Lewinellaceae bacterium]|nr:sulfite exporter TauE/SafE family protein [Lewinellaceae bacterium]
MQFFQTFGLDQSQWIILFITALTIGMSKTGVFGLSTVMFPVMAALFGGKISAGVVLPMLIMADLFAVAYYRRHAEWKYLVKLVPWAFGGILLGTLLGNHIDDQGFKVVMGVIILISVVIMVWRDVRRVTDIPDFWWFSMTMGVAAGFTSMVGNLAGSVTALYLLSMRLPKNGFIGTGAWFFLLVNSLKVPFHVFSWETITLGSFQLNLLMFPVIAIGALLGVKITAYLSDAFYRKFVIGVTLLSAGLLFW